MKIADSDKLFALSSDINSDTDITPRKDDVEFSKNRLFRRVRQESSSRRICNFFHMYIKRIGEQYTPMIFFVQPCGILRYWPRQILIEK